MHHNEVSPDEDCRWGSRLTRNLHGDIQETPANIAVIIRHDQKLQGIYLDELTGIVSIKDTDVLPWKHITGGNRFSDTDEACLETYLSEKYGLCSHTNSRTALMAVAAERSEHPIRQMIKELPEWDGQSRVDELFIRYLGAEDNSYVRAVTRKTMVAALARIQHPGIKFDCIPILQGPQGIGKSTMIARIGGHYYSDSLSMSDMKDKTAAEKLCGFWILELSELSGMRKVEIETLKSFLSRTDDVYRKSYGHYVESHPRQCIFIGTTNAEEGFLRDITGNRRFWPIVCKGGKESPWDLSRESILQIWAEALNYLNNGETLYLEGEDAEMAEHEQTNALEHDAREGVVRLYLNRLLPVNWSMMELSERREFLMDDKVGTVPREYVCNMEIWTECFGKDRASLKKSDSYEISAIMRKIPEWKRYQGTQNGSYIFPLYGKQRAYQRTRGKEECNGGQEKRSTHIP